MTGPAPAPTVRVLVVDDSVAFREAAHDLIEGVVGFVWIGEACSGEDGVEQTGRLRPDLVLMDVCMPGIGGIEAAAQIAAQVMPPVVLLITAAGLAADIPRGTATEILAKNRLSRESLIQLWEVHGHQS